MLNVTAWMARCLYYMVSAASVVGVGVVFWIVYAGWWVSVVVCFWVKNLSSMGIG